MRIICVTFSEDKNENYMQCLNLVTKIETSLLEDVVVDEHYSCQMPIETIIYDENMELYQVGELMTIWELPQIHRNVRQVGKYAESEQNSHKGGRNRTGGKIYDRSRKTAGNGKYERHRGKIYLYRTDNKHRVG